MIIIGMYASIFLVALVSFAENEYGSPGLTLAFQTGSNDHRYRHPLHHERVPHDRGCRLVRQRLHVDSRHFQSAFWPHLPALFHQTGLPHLHHRLRGRLRSLRCRPQLRSFHRRTRHCWYRRCWHLLRRHNDHRSSRSPSQEANIHLLLRCGFWCLICARASNWRLICGQPVSRLPAPGKHPILTPLRSLTWRWCFYINLPIGGFTFAAILLFLHIESPPHQKLTVLNQLKRLDPVGLLFLVPSMVCLILALQWGGTTYPWSAPRIVGLLVAFAIFLVAFLTVEVLMPETAMAPTRVVLNRSVGGSMLFMFLISGGMMVVVYYLSIWFQAVQGQSAMEAGIRTIPLVLSLVVMGIVGAIFTESVGYYVPAMLLSPCLCAVGGGLLSTLTPSAGSSHWIGYQTIYGFGIGCGFQTSHLAPQNVLARADVPLGMGLMFFMQQLGGSVFLSVGQNIFSSQLVDRMSGIADVNSQAILNAGATAYRNMVPLNDLNTVINAYSYALTRVFILSAALSACTILGAGIVEWKSIKGKKSRPSNTDETNEKGKNEANEKGRIEANKEEKSEANDEVKIGVKSEAKN